MKKMILAICLFTFLAGCKNEPETPPTAVLEDMFAAMKQGNLESMKNYITKQDIAMLDAAEKIMTGVDPEGMKDIKTRIVDELKENAKDIRFTLKNEKIDGDHATVDAEIINTAPTGDSVKKNMTQTFELVKENNAWKIALSKPGNAMFNSMKGNMGAKRGDLKDGLEKLQKMDPDSLKMIIGKAKQALDSMSARKK
ncbi:MAG: DUF4878 domain-containing protein [Chitinophagaceae bacterium]|nr:DUF4878 domain-containing protein [Chitinophagaceae bacterium]